MPGNRVVRSESIRIAMTKGMEPMNRAHVRVRVSRYVMVAALAVAALLLSAPAEVSAQSLPTAVPVTGVFDGGTFAGTVDVVRFEDSDGALQAVAMLTGTLVDANGDVVGTVTDVPVRLPVSALAATCDILHLDLGPLDLELLGLRVHLDRVVLDITAELGGGLLGTLLCAIAGLLDGGAPLAALIELLDRILDILRLLG